jgi:hypothetical protein
LSQRNHFFRKVKRKTKKELIEKEASQEWRKSNNPEKPPDFFN